MNIYCIAILLIVITLNNTLDAYFDTITNKEYAKSSIYKRLLQISNALNFHNLSEHSPNVIASDNININDLSILHSSGNIGYISESDNTDDIDTIIYSYYNRQLKVLIKAIKKIDLSFKQINSYLLNYPYQNLIFTNNTSNNYYISNPVLNLKGNIIFIYYNKEYTKFNSNYLHIKVINYKNKEFNIDNSIFGNDEVIVSNKTFLAGINTNSLISTYSLYQYKTSYYVCFNNVRLVVIVTFVRSG